MKILKLFTYSNDIGSIVLSGCSQLFGHINCKKNSRLCKNEKLIRAFGALVDRKGYLIFWVCPTLDYTYHQPTFQEKKKSIAAFTTYFYPN